MKYYQLKNKEMPWGDYGNILLTGMTMHLGRKNRLLQLERTGPFQPNMIISGVWDLIVTESFKQKLHSLSLSGIKYKPVIKKLITDVDWTNWDLNAEEPQFYPEEGEPENYILELPHSTEIANIMENVWEVIPTVNGKWIKDNLFQLGNKPPEIMKIENRGSFILSENFKNWLVLNEAHWLDFEEIENKLL